MNLTQKLAVAAFLIAAYAVSVRAGGLNDLESFVRMAKSGKAEFTQVVTQPAREGQVARSRISNGSFAFARPLRFRFDYRKPFAQTIVADGTTLWLYDQDLNQVTARKQAAALASTPAALIASAADLAALQADFTLSEAPAQEGLEWVLAMPKSRDSGLQSVRVGFKAGELARLDILDSFGQRSVLSFSAYQANPVLDAATFQFKPPAGADVVRQ
ncbi:outer membrane lipoprotein chaperone LolA [Curvibacter sp. APW13]|uniref:outer membrane lipoprotein chaperone LolA n=1 Tax=Curvibacter sp. APW13 TaxID=3077236 RepID=UPI0028DF31C5|nr:outer membrane lipoprotein chaperone LolA [Curvibacter sp. APW13]MDT8992341.1 outer membrane lipoprotein chaperone LolA [Curvibacter sp. APW13]